MERRVDGQAELDRGQGICPGVSISQNSSWEEVGPQDTSAMLGNQNLSLDGQHKVCPQKNGPTSSLHWIVDHRVQ